MKRLSIVLLLLFASEASAIERNVASQKLVVQVLDRSTGGPKTGDAANLTCYVSIDGDTSPDALGDTSATELSSTNAPGLYQFDLTQGETNGINIVYSGKSATASTDVVPRFIATTPTNASLAAIDSSGRHTANVTQLAGVTQSLTDLKDFADEGYDPSENSVVLVAETLVSNEVNSLVTGAIVAGSFSAGAINDAAWNVTETVNSNLVSWAGTAPLPVVNQRIQVDLRAIGGDTTSLADFKDMVDEAYDPTGNTIAATGGSALTVQQIVDGVWDELKAGHAVVGSFGESDTVVQDAILNAEDFDEVYSGSQLETDIANIEGVADWSDTEKAQILAALSVGQDIGVPAALTWTIARIDGQMKARSPIVKDVGEQVDVAADFRGVLADNDAILEVTDIELIDDSGAEAITSPAFADTGEATLWMNSAVRFTIAGGTVGDQDRVRVKVLTVGGSTISAPCQVNVTGGP